MGNTVNGEDNEDGRDLAEVSTSSSQVLFVLCSCILPHTSSYEYMLINVLPCKVIHILAETSLGVFSLPSSLSVYICVIDFFFVDTRRSHVMYNEVNSNTVNSNYRRGGYRKAY